MNDQEYLKLWRKAVDAFLIEPDLHSAGLCYGLCRASETPNAPKTDFYEWVGNFLENVTFPHSYISAPGLLSYIRMTIVLIMAELDDDTIIYIRDIKS